MGIVCCVFMQCTYDVRLLYESGGARQVHHKHHQPGQHLFQRKNELPWVGLEPTTLCLLVFRTSIESKSICTHCLAIDGLVNQTDFPYAHVLSEKPFG